MGSNARGYLTGFVCRLCSKMNRRVVLIYGEEGKKMDLEGKINSFLPVNISRNDPLPKTVCMECMSKLKDHDKIVQMCIKRFAKPPQEQGSRNVVNFGASTSGHRP